MHEQQLHHLVLVQPLPPCLGLLLLQLLKLAHGLHDTQSAKGIINAQGPEPTDPTAPRSNEHTVKGVHGAGQNIWCERGGGWEKKSPPPTGGRSQGRQVQPTGTNSVHNDETYQ